MDSTQKVAIITGAGLVAAYRELGYAVVATSRSVNSTHPEVLAVPGNLSRPGTGADVVEPALNRFGRIDTLVNDAGVFIAKPFADYTDEDYDAVAGVNLRGFFDISSSAIAAMLAHGGGHLVNVSTSLVDHANSQVPAALASLAKGGHTAVTKSLAIEYAHPRHPGQRRGARDHPHPMHPADNHETLAGMHPLGRIGEIDDVVEAIVYLEQARFVTGEILHVDGGQSAGH
jgi:NAD(P)-dependent dehydrogenase (short-subunit alcohol dehydrogenase family)